MLEYFQRKGPRLCYIPVPSPSQPPIPNTPSVSSNPPLSTAKLTASPAPAALISSSPQPAVVYVLHIPAPVFDDAENNHKNLLTRTEIQLQHPQDKQKCL